ncbi:hypothetical protein CAJCM15448_42880 [Candidozyma auris]|nr:hypothetical protein CAJCM15448_42880 [[Candida] auris]
MSTYLTSSQKAMSETPATSPFTQEPSPVHTDAQVPTSSEDATMTDAPQDATQKNSDALDLEDEEMPEIDDAVMSLPLSKIRRIFKMDPDYYSASQGAVFATGAATELFVQHFMEHAAMMAKMEKRKKIQYKDLSTVVSTQDSLHFLSDTVPKTQPVGQAMKERKINLQDEDQRKHADLLGTDDNVASENAAEPVDTSSTVLTKGQQTLPFEPAKKPATIKKAVIHDLMSTDDDQNNSPIVIED